VGGAAVANPGESQTFGIHLRPGTYFAMCFVEDPKSGAPHFAMGMMKRFTVR
jgi:hypothetical protein